MCLAIPVKLVLREENKGWVEMGNTKREVDLTLLPDAKVGDYVLVHAGFAISKVEEKEAEELLELLSKIL
ncbi:HypC/HybG/HupF family hydrogenase formation chaperone [Candidatus Aerophobetes bacterium]|uniref:HypC/HybG/HupF family hydrogenase formation chaperone n=1 Tax=Aerophobetes bacterium TaxID=2030807 RepID=A0A7V5I103_UNCAE|nr:HypC/HybG/HupF family hydrogenase formation chaperone [Candidatus Aerophobetes bacterium]HHF98467.1 HypC/HybG/HupF family hydrogenase formation chaperone [Candidatus Aerophobetes bacterium]